MKLLDCKDENRQIFERNHALISFADMREYILSEVEVSTSAI